MEAPGSTFRGLAEDLVDEPEPDVARLTGPDPVELDDRPLVANGVALDADEALSADSWHRPEWRAASMAEPGTVLRWPWANILPGGSTYFPSGHPIPFGFVGTHTSIVWLSVAMFIRGTGIGFGFMPAMTAAFASLKRSELSDATPQLNVLQRVGGSIGTALLAVVLQRALAHSDSLGAAAGAYGTAFWWSLGLTALAIAPCLVLLRAERTARAAHAVVPAVPLAEAA